MATRRPSSASGARSMGSCRGRPGAIFARARPGAARRPGPRAARTTAGRTRGRWARARARPGRRRPGRRRAATGAPRGRGRLVAADGQQGDVDVVAAPDLGEAREVARVAREVDARVVGADDVAASAAVAGPRVADGHGDDLDVGVLERRAGHKLGDGQEAQARDQRTAARRHDDGHVLQQPAQAPGRQVVAVGVRDQREVDVFDVAGCTPASLARRRP